jgi:hypothetical protein
VSYCERHGSELEVKILADAIATAHSQMRQLAVTKHAASTEGASRQEAAVVGVGTATTQ